jgi:predicted phage-related endonuclease
MPVRIRDITGQDEWLTWRNAVIGASEAGAVLGLDPYKSPLALYHEKAGTLPRQPSTELMERGIDLEPGIIHAFQRRHPEYSVWQARRFYDHPDLKLGCTPDAFFCDVGDHECFGDPTWIGVLQCKLVSKSAFEKWNGSPPVHYQLQTMMEARFAEAGRAVLAAYVIGEHTGELHEFEIDFRSPEALQAYERFLQYAAAFWQDFAAGKEPALTPALDLDLVKRLYPVETEVDRPLDLNDDGELRQLLNEHKALTDRMSLLNEQLRPLEAERELKRTQIKAKLGAASRAVCNGQDITWTTQSKQASTSRVLRIAPLKKAS